MDVKYDIEGLTNDPIFSCFHLNLNKEAIANQYQNEAFMHIKIKSLNRFVDNSTNAVAVYFTDTNPELPTVLSAKSINWFKLPVFSQNIISLEKIITETKTLSKTTNRIIVSNITEKVTYRPVISLADDIHDPTIYQGDQDQIDLIVNFRTLETTTLRYTFKGDFLKMLALIGGFFGVLGGILVIYTIFVLAYLLIRDCCFQKSIKNLHRKVKDFSSKLDDGIELKTKESLMLSESQKPETLEAKTE